MPSDIAVASYREPQGLKRSCSDGAAPRSWAQEYANHMPPGKKRKSTHRLPEGRPGKDTVTEGAIAVRLQGVSCEEPEELSLQHMPQDVRVKIFSSVDHTIHRHVLPLVCKAWAAELRSPLVIYNHLDIDISAELQSLPAGAKVDAEQVAAWLGNRSESIWSLRFRNLNKGAPDVPFSIHNPPPPPTTHNFCGANLAALLRPLLHLQELVIEECQNNMLTSATFEAIGHLSKLKVLSLKGIQKNLDDEDFGAIMGLQKLEELVLDCDQAPAAEPGVEEMKWGLQGFPEGMEHLVNITHLTLSSHPGITHLPLMVGKLSKLQVLNVDFCQLKDLPACLGNLTSLTTLDVEGNAELGVPFQEVDDPTESHQVVNWRTGFPHGMEALANIRYLNLNSCGLRALPSVLSSFSNLQTLDVEENDLGDLRYANWDVAKHWGTLQCLNVAACKITELPPTVPLLTSLRILDLTNNQLRNEGIPDSLSALAQLKAIGLKGNRLREVPQVLGRLSALEEIYLEDNIKLEVPRPVDFLAELSQLRILMMGKPTNYAPVSVHFMAELMRKLTRKYPTRDILRISYPGNFDGEVEDGSAV